MDPNHTSFRWDEVEPLCLLKLLARKWWLIVMAALIGAMLTSAALGLLAGRSTYSSTVTVTVTARTNNGNY